VKGEKDEDKDINSRLPMEQDGPIRFLVFGVKEKAGEDLDPEK